MTGNRKGRNRTRREIDRQVRDDLRSRAGQNRKGQMNNTINNSVPLQRAIPPKQGLRTRVNGELNRERTAVRKLTHKSGAGGCAPNMSTVSQQVMFPFAEAPHVVIPRSTSRVLLVSDAPGSLDRNYRDTPRGTQLQYDYSASITTTGTGDFYVNINSWGMPFSAGVGISPTGSGTGYTDLIAVSAAGAYQKLTTWRPIDGPGNTAFQANWQLLGLKVTMENMVETIQDQVGTVVVGQLPGVAGGLGSVATGTGGNYATLSQFHWTTVYDGATTIGQPTLNMIPRGIPFGILDAEIDGDIGLVDPCAGFFLGHDFPIQTEIKFRIRANYILVGPTIPPVTPITYDTKAFECAVMCLQGDQSMVSYEEKTGGSTDRPQEARAIRRRAEKQAAGLTMDSIPDWLIQTGQAVLPDMAKLLTATVL